METFINNFKKFIEPLSPAQRIMFGLMVALVLLLVGLLIRWTLQPDYSILYGSLQPEIAAEIVEELDRNKIPYRIEDGGRSIFIPSDKVHEMRMKLASTTAAGPGVQGYELFDSNTLGMTDFMQQVNRKRALEGELSRSINTIEQVEFSRVHLVMPERAAFQQQESQATASVILSLRRGQQLSRQQVEGITSLIAGSVEGLSVANVTVLDQNGNRLTDEGGADGQFASGNTQIQLRQRTESYLTERGQSMLDRVLGPGNAILRVAAEHDFDRILRESDLLDPDSRIVISEEQRTTTNTDESFQQVPIDDFTPINLRGQTVLMGNRNNEQTVRTRNYQVNQTREIHERGPGELRRISASVLLNYKRTTVIQEDGQEPIVNYEPYTQQEIQELQNVIRTALGIQPGRGDEITITQIQFYDPNQDMEYAFWLQQPTQWNEIVRYVMILIALLVVVGLVYSMTRRINQESLDVMFKPQGEVMQEQDQLAEAIANAGSDDDELEISPDDFMSKKLSKSARRQLAEKSMMLDEIRKFVGDQGEEATNLIRNMMTR
ncbi:MAG: flagellar M-ring protein FliF [Bacteroidetes bacterium]|nr:flagellar M-ring protein FliF [Bacteroidota bacterium]MCH8523835.1 flagellar M-ring protein FliF [Balneolales bacterium]